MKKVFLLIIIGFSSSIIWAQTLERRDTARIVQTLVDAIGRPVPRDFNLQQSGVYGKVVQYWNSDMAAYMYFVNSNNIVTRTVFFAGYNGTYDVLNEVMAWMIVFDGVEGASKVPGENLTFIYNRHFITFQVSDEYARIVVRP